MDNVRTPNTEGLKAHAREKKDATFKKVDIALQKLIKEKGRINFNSISMESGVSKAYLYNHSDVRERIETLRKQQEGLPSPKQVKREMTNASKDVLIAAKNKRIKALEEENKRLKSELVLLEVKYMTGYDKVTRIKFCFLKLILVTYRGGVWGRAWAPFTISIYYERQSELLNGTIVTILENGKTKVLETIIDDAEAVLKYKTLVENRHTPGELGYTPIYLSWIEF